MKITQVKEETILKKIAEVEAAKKTSESTLKKISEQLGALHRQEDAAEEAIRANDAELCSLRRLLVLRNPVPREIVSLRNQIVRKMNLAESGEILVREKDALEAGVNKLKADLVSKCSHPLVVQTEDPYAGSYIHDNDDCHRGHRICAICEFSDSSVSTREDIYEKLGESDERIVVRAVHLERTPLVKRSSPGTWDYRIVFWMPIGEIVDCFFAVTASAKLQEAIGC